MKTVALYSVKGGVGKTTCAVNLSYAASRLGRETLLVDLDPQGAASFYLRTRPAKGFKSKKMLKETKHIERHLRESDYPGLDVLPAAFGFRKLDLFLGDMKRPEKGLERVLDGLGDNHDLVVIDAPPGMTLLSESILRAADMVIVPVVPNPLSERALRQVLELMERRPVGKQAWKAFFSMVDVRKKVHRETMVRLRREFPGCLESVIPSSSEIERMAVKREPILVSVSSRKPVVAYRRLCNEILTEI